MKGLAALDKKMGMSSGSEPSESEDAAQDILDAIASKDVKALDLALQRHAACCEGEPDEDDASEEV